MQMGTGPVLEVNSFREPLCVFGTNTLNFCKFARVELVKRVSVDIRR